MWRRPESKILSFDEVAALGEKLRAQGLRVVSTNGCFDLLHWGHLSYLNEARALGDRLFCAVNADDSVRGLKGPGRPIHDERTRALQLAALEAVDYVAIFREKTPEEILRRLRPAIHVKGGDYRPEDLPERAIVETGGGKVVCLPFVPGRSSTSLIEKLNSL